MRKKLFIIAFIIFFIGGGEIIIELITKENENNEQYRTKIAKVINNTSQNLIDENIENNIITNDVNNTVIETKNNINETIGKNEVEDNKMGNENTKERRKDDEKNRKQEIKEDDNTQLQNEQSTEQLTSKENNEISNQVEYLNLTINNIESNTNDNTTTNIGLNPTTDVKEEDIDNADEKNSKAESVYYEENTEVINEVISILNKRISKNENFKKAYDDIGVITKAVSASRNDVMNNTSGFTYMFVKDITKGKVPGNYIVFDERVTNKLKISGTYYVYAEDEYTYDSKGINSYWSQTLVYIYIKI